MVCNKMLSDGVGLFCGNFSSKRGAWNACQQAWCGRCYKALDANEFPVARLVDEEGVDVSSPEDETRYLQARNGDNFVTPFQCDLCHFRNAMQRDPVGTLLQDIRLLKTIQRANLDALWSREPSTVRSTLTLCRQGGRIAASLGFKNRLFRPMGPHPLEDTFGIGAAIVMLHQSLAPGKYDKHIQFVLVRKFRSAFSNVYHVTAEGQEAMVLAKDVRKMSVTKCPTYREFFERFMRGMHKRMGEITRPDRAISLALMLELQRMLEQEWLNQNNDRMIAMEASFYLVSFCCALRGEEVPLAHLHGVIKYWEAGETGEDKHMVVPLLGRFKGETGESYHLICSVDITAHGLEPRKWIGRLISILQNDGIRNGPLFRGPHGQRLKASHFEPAFISRLEHIQETKPELLPASVDVEDEFGVSRSFRRGATSEAVNNGVKPDVINVNNRWRKMNQAGASRPSLSMREHYTDVRLTLKHRLLFSKAL